MYKIKGNQQCPSSLPNSFFNQLLKFVSRIVQSILSIALVEKSVAGTVIQMHRMRPVAQSLDGAIDKIFALDHSRATCI
jgi:hypothetical protein